MAFGDQAQYPKWHFDPDRCDFAFNLPIGATGAPGTIEGTPGFTFTRTGAGTYTGTFPKAVSIYFAAPSVISAAGTVIDATFTALSAANGTFALTTRNAAGTATDPANGDILTFTGSVKMKAV